MWVSCNFSLKLIHWIYIYMIIDIYIYYISWLSDIINIPDVSTGMNEYGWSRSPVLALRHGSDGCMACLLPPGFQGGLKAPVLCPFFELFHRWPRLVLQIQSYTQVVNSKTTMCLLFFLGKTVLRFPSGCGNAGRNHTCKPAIICVSYDLMTSLRSWHKYACFAHLSQIHSNLAFIDHPSILVPRKSDLRVS